jgi:hypothetical protein
MWLISEKTKKNKKKDKKFSAKISVTDDQSTTNGKFSEEKSDLYIYDIPKKFQNSDIEDIIKIYGKVVSYEIKRLHKYQLIRAEIYLDKDWIRNEKPYTTVSYKDEILNLRHVYANVEKSKVDEAWKRKAIIKIPGYNGKRNDIQANMRYLRGKNLDVPIIYGKNIVIQGKIYFWVIFGTDERVKLAEKLSKEKNVDNGWEILTNSKFVKQKKELGKKNLLSTILIENSEKDKKKEKAIVTKSQLRKEYKANTTETQKSQEKEVVDIVD